MVDGANWAVDVCSDPSSLAQPYIPHRGSRYYLDVASASEYGAVARLSESAPRAEVALPLTTDAIRWLVETNPAGRGFIVVAKARDDETIIGYLLFYPKRMMARSRLDEPARGLTVFLYVTLFVVPEYRRHGVFSAMARYGIDLLSLAGVQFAYTVPNPRSTPGFIKMGIGRIGKIPFWAFPAGRLTLAARLLEAPGRLFGRSFRAERVERFDAELIARVAVDAPVGALVWGARSVAELEWRFLRRPEIPYEVWSLVYGDEAIGYAVSRRMCIEPFDTTILCDAWVTTHHRRAIGSVLSRLRDDPAANWRSLLISIGGHSGAYSPTAMMSAAMLPVPSPLLPQPVALIGAAVGDQPAEHWMMPGSLRHWYVTPYDWDVF